MGILALILIFTIYYLPVIIGWFHYVYFHKENSSIDVDNISERMKEFAENINDFHINQSVYYNKKKYIITDKTRNSIEVYYGGYKQWFSMKEFNFKFKINE